MIKLKPSQICTNYKQSNRLVKAGVLPETADMYVYEHNGSEYIGFGSPDSEAISRKALPAWSLDRLIDMLPKRSLQFVIRLEICCEGSEENPLYTFDGHEFEAVHSRITCTLFPFFAIAVSINSFEYILLLLHL